MWAFIEHFTETNVNVFIIEMMTLMTLYIYIYNSKTSLLKETSKKFKKDSSTNRNKKPPLKQRL